MRESIKYSIFDTSNITELQIDYFSSELIEVIFRLSSAYPFTFLEKESFRNHVDKLDNVLWVKNSEGICELVNQKLANSIGVIPLQVEGNKDDEFFDSEHLQFVQSSSTLIKELKKIILLHDIRLFNRKEEEKLDFLVIPILNHENSVVATISIGLNHQKEKKPAEKEKNSHTFINLKNLPLAAVFLSPKGTIEDANNKFARLFSFSNTELRNLNINELLGDNFSPIFKDFINSPNYELTINNLEIIDKPNEISSILLGKVFDENNVNSGTVIIFNEIIEKSTNKNLHSEQSMMENLIRRNPDPVFICDKENLKFLELNENAINLYGYRRDEFLQMDLTDLFLAEDIQLLSESSDSEIKEGSFYGPYKHKCKDGKIIFVEMSRISIKYENREANFVVIKNITNELETKKKNEYYKSVFESTNDLVFITDSAGFINYLNEQAAQKIGLSKNELLDSTFTSLVVDNDRTKVNQSIFHSGKKEKILLTISIKSHIGKPLNVNLTAIPILSKEKEITAFSIICEVIHSVDSVIDKPNGVPLLASSDGAVASESINTKFLAQLFHDLLTPINVIVGYAQDISENDQEHSNEQREAASIIAHNREQLLQLMNAAIDFSGLVKTDSLINIRETKIIDVIDTLVKEIAENKILKTFEFGYGKISSSLRFETDSEKFKNFLLLLFRIIVSITNQKKLYFSAYSLDKDSFIITYRDLQTYSSAKLISALQSLFENKDTTQTQINKLPAILFNLINLLLVKLKGKFIVLSDDKNKPDYGIAFPFVFRKNEEAISELTHLQPNSDSKSFEHPGSSIGNVHLQTTVSEQEAVSKADLKPSNKQPSKFDENLRNELRIEMLKEKIRTKEAELQKSKHVKNVEEKIDDEKEKLVQDSIQYFDLDLQANSDEPITQDEIEIVETSASKEKIVELPKTEVTDEKINVSNFSCLYFEDQIDSQILFRLQMKGLKKLDFAVSFEQSLPLLEAGDYDFIVIDINLQGSYNGLDILRILRTMPKYESIPVIAVTAYVLPGDQQKFVVAGFSGFISKPIFRDEMIDVLAEIFNQPEKT
ncbi:MAG: PAS domain S-box protein [Ignavibacteriaceae bacterium]|nr:PAS domain S-box protein [Ignavibacteriaceae bacterium]